MSNARLNGKFATAIKNARLKEAIRMIADGADINRYYPRLLGAPLNYAVYYPELFEALLDAGADPLCGSVPPLHRTPAIHSTLQPGPGMEPCTKILLDRGTDPNTRVPRNGRTPAMTLAYCCDHERSLRLATILHDHGADFSVCDVAGDSVVDHACRQMTRLTSGFPPSMNVESFKEVPMAFIDLVTPWSTPPRYIDPWDDTPEDARPVVFNTLARLGHRDEIDRFIANGVIEQFGREALQLGLRGAIGGKHLDLIDRFIKLGAELNEAPPIERDWPAPIIAAISHEHILRALIERGANVDVIDQFGKSLLRRLEDINWHDQKQGKHGCPELIELVQAKLDEERNRA
ncbi:MAG: hypothetical protein GC159_10620 [Phycisphaera sp.]|nr:hypothetical protein [Phycisphaera sp.]